MKEKESIKEFYEQRFPDEFKSAPENTGQFYVFRKEKEFDKQHVKYARRDFYKITLIRGHHLFHYAEKTLEISNDTLLFSNPEVPYTIEPIDEESGYCCLFKENFLVEYLRTGFRELPMYRIGGSPVFILDKSNNEKISLIFEKIIEENDSDFHFKYDLIRNYVMEIIYTALKLQPSEKVYQNTDANTRITTVFMELLERQFPIENITQQFTMKSAKDFAQKLNVHINHLNRAVKTATGKTTSEIIYERLANEAKALLKHTDWNVAEIGFCLGFEDPAHFNHFFKKQTGTKPSDFRM
jgi:AraC-like DNA-binding protein